jgi:hypothetical protein
LVRRTPKKSLQRNILKLMRKAVFLDINPNLTARLSAQ